MGSSANITWLAPVFGVVAMLLTSLLKNKNWSENVKMVILCVVSIAMALVQIFISGQKFDTTGDFLVDLGTVSGVVLATATVIYKTFFNKTAVNDKLTKIGYNSGS